MIPQRSVNFRYDNLRRAEGDAKITKMNNQTEHRTSLVNKHNGVAEMGIIDINVLFEIKSKSQAAKYITKYLLETDWMLFALRVTEK